MIELQNPTQEKSIIIPEASSIRGAKILVVDDSPNNLQLMGGLLKKFDCEVLIAQNAYSALKIAETKFPDLILLDVLMPETDGFEIHQLFKSNIHTSGVPIIYVSASNNTENIIRGFKQGACDYIIKPFNHEELIARISHHLKKKKERTQIQMLFNSRMHSYIMLNQHLEITGFNQTAENYEPLFVPGKLKIGESLFSCLDSCDHSFIRRRLDTAYKGRLVEFEKKYLEKETTKWYNYTIEQSKENRNDPGGFIISGTEVTTKKETEIEDADFLQKINDVHHETQQSLTYASRIQKAILPKEAEISGYFNDSFVLFKPKDKVSGDFFWAHETEHKKLIVLGDCTGHGVPGALLTTISIVLLERIVKFQKIESPEKILSELNSNIVTILKQNNGGVKDGLEMAICLLDKNTRSIEFAGAKRSIVMVHNDQLTEIKGDRMEIGGDEKKKFTRHSIKPLKNTALYFYSDGITDQIGGEKNKKYLKKRLHQLILSLRDETMPRQKNIFNTNLVDWMGRGEQTDDILFIGIRI